MILRAAALCLASVVPCCRSSAAHLSACPREDVVSLVQQTALARVLRKQGPTSRSDPEGSALTSDDTRSSLTSDDTETPPKDTEISLDGRENGKDDSKPPSDDGDLTVDNENEVTADPDEQTPKVLSAASDSYYWSQDAGKPSRLGASPYVVLNQFGSIGPSWKFVSESQTRTSPLVDDDRSIYLAESIGVINKFNDRGKLLWKRSLGANISTTPALMQEALYVVTDTGELVSLHMRDGTDRWRNKPNWCSTPKAMSLNAGSGVIVIASGTSAICSNKKTHGSGIVAFQQDGSVRWSFSTGHESAIYTAMKDASLIVMITEKVFNLNVNTGKALWVHTFTQHSVATTTSKPSRSSKTKAPVAQAAQKTKQKGKPTKNKTTGGHDKTEDHQAALESEGSEINKGGRVILPHSDTVRATVGPKGVVYVTSNPVRGDGKQIGRLAALNHSTGSLLWHADTELAIVGGPAIGSLEPDGTQESVVITVANTAVTSANGAKKVRNNGKVLTYAADTGALNTWTYETPTWLTSTEPTDPCRLSTLSSPAIGGDGTVYVAGGDRKLYAIKDNGDGIIKRDEVSFFSAHHAFGSSSVSIGPGLLIATPCDGMVVWKTF